MAERTDFSGKGEVLLQARGVTRIYPVRGGLFEKRGYIKALSSLTLHLEEGENLGIIGESGSGKSTLGRVISLLEEPDEGEIIFRGKGRGDLSEGGESKGIRREIQMIFQDPYASLNPRHRVKTILKEPFLIHFRMGRREMEERVRDLLGMVGLPSGSIHKFPHEFSGGERQRIAIVRALSLNPSLIVADEPVSSLDVSVQAQILDIMMELKERFSLTYLFISHDVGVVESLCDRVGVIYCGELVELLPSAGLRARALHPYTEGLIASVPSSRGDRKIRVGIKGEPFTLIVEMEGGRIPPTPFCPFHERCPGRMALCKEAHPELKEVEEGHLVACFLFEG